VPKAGGKMDKQQNTALKNLISDYVQQCIRTHNSAIYRWDDFDLNQRKKLRIRQELIDYINSLTESDEHSDTDRFFSQYCDSWTSQKDTFFPEGVIKLPSDYENERKVV
jgi:hypothetical protein